MKDMRDFTLTELRAEVAEMGEPAHRAKQIFLWLNRKGADSFDKMTDLPGRFIEELKKKFRISELECSERVRAKDGTEKFLWKLTDDEYVETVLITEKSRKTLCLSTQAGCKFKCPFCASGEKGFMRDLRVFEIVGQVMRVRKMCKCRITNIVFMGMGEPLDNYSNVVKAIQIINDPAGIGIGARKITVSTCGIVPGIVKLKNIGVQVELSVSLHAANDKLRNELVPANRKYPLKKLIAACDRYSEDTGRIITLEYILIQGKNDSRKNAEELIEIARDLRAKVNLIGCNSFKGFGSDRTYRGKIDRFAGALRAKGVTVTIRKSKGTDIQAACGQLAAKAKT